jgi:hypothetical protein
VLQIANRPPIPGMPGNFPIRERPTSAAP